MGRSIIMNPIKKTKQKLFRGYCRLRAHIHVHHWRGHGIHSPFMYGVVRNVFMKNRFIGNDFRLYQYLRRERVSHQQALLIQNLYTHCRMEHFQLLPDPQTAPRPGRTFLTILRPDAPMECVERVVQQTFEAQGNLIFLAPHRSTHYRQMAEQIWQRYPCVSVDRRVMILYFFDPKIPAQHYRI